MLSSKYNLSIRTDNSTLSIYKVSLNLMLNEVFNIVRVNIKLGFGLILSI
jgi:hypothetical protein